MLQFLESKFFQKRKVPFLARSARCKLGFKVTSDLNGLTGVALNDSEDRLNRSSLLIELEQRNAKPLLKNLCRMNRHTSRGDPPDVAVMRHRRSVSAQHLQVEKRFDDVDVR